MEAAGKSVCVTGAGGFIASWLVKLLLSRGQYTVRGTVRDPGASKNAHLKVLEGAGERLQLIKTDLLDYNSVSSAVAGCEGVFHVASPVPSGRSSNPEDWYYLSKTLAEREAFAYAAKMGLDVVTICPSLVLGPLMQPTMNSSSKILHNYFKGDRETVENRLRNIVDVRDVADALLLVYEKPEASGRYICSSPPIKVSDMIKILKNLYPTYPYPKKEPGV
ncbi:unnamed protein product [Urochloa humidicola]